MVSEGDFEMFTEDELSDSGTEESTDVEIYEFESDEETDEAEEETDESEEEAEAKSKESAKDEMCEVVIDTSGKADKLLEKEIREDCRTLESEEKKSRNVESSESKPKEIRRYCCQICGVIRAKRTRLKDHILSHHGVEIDAAEVDELIEKKNPEDCEARTRRKDENNGFKRKEFRRYCCTLCGVVRSKRKLLENHIISEHSVELKTKGEVDTYIEKKRPEDDQRRYACPICGVIRSKRVLIELHVRSSHGPEALKSEKIYASEETNKHSPCVCNMCGMSFTKPSHLQQHKISHTALRSFACPIDGCHCSYKRQDHLNRHLLKHEGEQFVCPKEDCKLQLSTLSNLRRHLNRHRERGESWQSQSVKSNKTTKKHICPDISCRKAFTSPSRLAKHLEDVHSTTYTEIICCEPSCLKYFSNAVALKEHLRQAHNRISCEVCGSQQLKKQIKRHMRIHDNQTCVKSIACPYERCLHTYTTKSNLRQHIKSVHLELKPFKCKFRECGMTFAQKCARDRHEKSGMHCYVQGNFVEEDAAFRSRPRGGRKRKTFTIDSIFRKRVAGPGQSSVHENGLSFMDWLMSDNAE